MSATLPEQPRRGARTPWAFLGGMALVLAVNGALVWVALSAFTGAAVEPAQDRGPAYDEVLAEAARQEAMGWHAAVALDVRGLVVSLHDDAGQPVAGTLSGVLVPPWEGTRGEGIRAPRELVTAPDVLRAAVEMLPHELREAVLRLGDGSGSRSEAGEQAALP
ncbi:MAG TPA: FixH family protein [Roseomonas sp.]|nr:FixH family protein [Roseomonas sp.]